MRLAGVSLEWCCVGHDVNGSIWALGIRNGDKVENILSYVSRLPDGSWFWRIAKPLNVGGRSPSRLEAFSDVEGWVAENGDEEGEG